jgi:hypothetical protein
VDEDPRQRVALPLDLQQEAAVALQQEAQPALDLPLHQQQGFHCASDVYLDLAGYQDVQDFDLQHHHHHHHHLGYRSDLGCRCHQGRLAAQHVQYSMSCM